ncbi:MAG: hypothetical protein U0324_16815 [Polyangiales bacterium]
MHRPGVHVALLLCLAACAHTASRTALPPRTATTPGAALELLPAWRDRPVAVALPGGAVGLLLGGARARWTPARDAVDAAPEASPVAFVEARPLAHGVVFRDERQRLWRAEDFLGPIHALGEGAASIVTPPGPAGSVAVRRGAALSITDGRDAFEPAGLGAGDAFAVVFCDATRGYARATDGLLDATADGGHTWAPTADEGAACEAPREAPAEVPEAVVARAREAALRAVPALLTATGAVALGDGRAVAVRDGAAVLWRADRTTAVIARDAACEVAAWGPCAAVLCGEGAALVRVCPGAEPAPVAHGCRGAFVLSDDGRHALCATSSLAVTLLDADANASTPSPLHFASLSRTTLHGATALAVEGDALVTTAPGAAPTREPLDVALDVAARLGDRALVGHAGDRLYWRPLAGGAWRRLDAVPPQPFGADGGSRLLARGDLSPAPPAFACSPDACRFGAAVVRAPNELPSPDADAPEAPAPDAPAPPTVVAEDALARCAATAPLARRRPLPGASFDGTVHAALDLRGPTATVRWITAAGARAVSLPTASLPGALSPGDDPDVIFPQGVPAALTEAGGALLVATSTDRGEATLWTLSGAAAPRSVALPGALPPTAGEALWEGAALEGGGAVLAESAVADEVATVRVWAISPAGEVAGTFATRSREFPYLASVGGAPGIVTWTPRAEGAVDIAFRGVRDVRRWRVRTPSPLALCTSPDPRADWAEVPVDVRVDREGVRAGTPGRAVVRMTRARVRLSADGLCVEALRGVTGAPAANGRGLFAADLFLTARGGALVGAENDGLRALPFRCAAR